MKKLLVAKILAIALILNPISALAQETRVSVVDAAAAGQMPNISESMTPAQLERAVSEISYSIENIEQSLNDLEKLAGGASGNEKTPAAGGMSKAVIQKLSERFGAGVELLAALQLDTKLPDQVRDGYVDRLNGRLGALFFKVLRFHGEDPLKIEEDFRRSSDIKQGMNKLQIGVARTKFYMTKIFKEFALDVRTLVTFKRAAIDSTIAGKQVPSIVWGPVDRARRNQLMTEIIPSLNRYATEILPQVQSDKDRLGAGRDFWVEKVLEKSILIRQDRVWGQKAATVTYIGLAGIGFFAPLIDIVGMANGFQRTDVTLDMSANAYFTIWMTMGMMKAATFMAKGTKTTIKALEGLVEYMKSVPPQGHFKRGGPTLPERLNKITNEVQQERAQLTAERGAVRTCRAIF